MLVHSVRASRSILARVTVRQTVVRTFITPTAIRQADLVQEIYLRELKAYKPVPEKASDAEGQVKKWSPPAPPKAPDSIGATLADELKAYEAAEVEVEGQASTTDGASAKDDDWFEEDLAFPPEEDAHH